MGMSFFGKGRKRRGVFVVPRRVGPKLAQAGRHLWSSPAQ